MSSYFWGKASSSAKCESQSSEDVQEKEPESKVTADEISSCVQDDYIKPDNDLEKEVEGEETCPANETGAPKEEESEADDVSSGEEEDSESEKEEERIPRRREYKIDQSKPMWVISVDGRSLFYTDSEASADKILWSAAKRCCRNVTLEEYSSVHLTPRSKNMIDITGRLNFVLMSYDQIIHRLTYRRAPFVTINNGKLD